MGCEKLFGVSKPDGFNGKIINNLRSFRTARSLCVIRERVSRNDSSFQLTCLLYATEKYICPMKSVFPLTPAPEQLSIVEILMKTNISCSLKKLPLDILIVISKFLNYSDILKWQQTCTTFHKILSDNSIWRGYCRRLDLYASKGIRNLQRHLVDYEKTKFLWLTSTYDYSILQQKSDYLCGILYLDSFVNSENLSPTIISGSWTGDIIQYKITLVEKCDPEALFDPVLFNDNPWNWTPPQTPCSTPIDPLPILVQGVKKLEEEKVLNFGRILADTQAK